MKQILAIFRKDARRFWPEILVSLIIVVAFVFVYPNTWRATDGPPFRGSIRFFGSSSPMGILASCLVVLIPISWWILIARLIHGERLVGDNQFWLTRPYEWPKFLGAKLLFLAVFLYAPFFIAQCVLLSEGGFRPFAYLPGLIYNLLLLTGTFVLPMAAVSAVTTGFGRMTLVTLGIILFIGGVALLYALLPANLTNGPSGPLGDNLSFLFIVVGCAAVVVVQYATRRVRPAWILLATVALLLSGLAFLNPDEAMMDRYYSTQGSNVQKVIQFSEIGDQEHRPSTNETDNKKLLEVVLPVQASGVSEGFVAMPTAVKAGIEAKDGGHWESHWQVIYNEHYFPGTSVALFRFSIPRAVFERFKLSPVKLTVAVAVDQARAVSTQSISLPTGEFAVPGIGICDPEEPWITNPYEITGIKCRSALRHPQLTYVNAHWTDDCSVVGPDTETMLGDGWTGSFDTDPAEFGITSVWETPLTFSNSWRNKSRGPGVQLRQICPGTPVTFTTYERVARTQAMLTIEDFRLQEITHYDLLQMLTK